MPFIAAFASLFARSAILQVIAAFGFAFVSYKGIDLLVGDIKQYIQNGVHSLPYATVALLDLGGFFEGLNILFGCIASKLALHAFQKLDLGSKL